MNADIRTLVMIDMDIDLGTWLEPFAVWEFEPLNVGPNDIVSGTDRNSLSELACMVGIHFPSSLLFTGAAYFDGDAVHRVAVGVPHRSKNQAVGLGLSRFTGSSGHGGQQRQ